MPIPSLTPHDLGAPHQPGKTHQTDAAVEITAGGADFWGRADAGHFACLPVSGDFTLTACLASLDMADTYTKAGLMLRASLDADAAHAMLLSFGDNQPRNRNNGALEFQYRREAGGDCLGIYPPQPLSEEPDFPASFPDHWLRLSRKGDVLTGAFSTDGVRWARFCTHTQTFEGPVFLGLAVTAHNDAQTVRAAFSHLDLTQP